MPQTSNRESYARAVDIWSLGIIVHEILTSEIPFLQTDSDQMSESGFESELAPPEVDMTQLYEYCHGYREFPIESLQNSQVSKDGKDFVMGLLVANPRARLSAASALKSPWLLDRSQEIGGKPQTPQIDPVVPGTTPLFHSDTEDASDYDNDSDYDSCPELSTANQPKSPVRKPRASKCHVNEGDFLFKLSVFIRKKRLGHFFPDDSTIAPYAEQAKSMNEALRLRGYSHEVADKLVVLTLYDLVILVGT